MKPGWLLLCVNIVLAACSGGSASDATNRVRPALVQIVQSGSDPGLDAFSGEIRARHETDLAFRIGGKIVARDVEVGAVVKAGQRLASLDPADAALQARKASDERVLAAAELRRYQELRAKNFISQAVLDAKLTAYQTADAEARLAGNQAAYATLLADRDGVITSLSAEPGLVVAAAQPVMRIARLDELEAVVNVPESRIKGLRQGDAASVGLWAGDGKRYTGRIREIAPAADAVTRTFTVKVTLIDRDPDLKLGMTANVVFAGAAAGDAVTVPLAALMGRDAAATAWVVDPKTQTVSPRAVTVVSYREDGAVIGSGLKPGEEIVIAGVHKLLAGERIAPIAAAAGSS